jgi:hypothetical protein
MRAIFAAILLIAAFTARAVDAPYKYLELEPDSKTKIDGGLIRLRFVYPGGCYDVDIPGDWFLMKTKEDFTRYGDPDTKCITLFMRWDNEPGKPHRDQFVDWLKLTAAWELAQQVELSKKYKKDVTDQRAQLDEAHLLPAQLGKGPSAREALVYVSDSIALNENIRKYVSSTMKDITFETNRKMTAKEAVRVRYSALDGKTRIMIQFNCRAQSWAAFEPKSIAVLESVVFPACTK